MKYINEFSDGLHVSGIYLCKSKNIALTRNGKEYANLVLKDKTGEIAAKIWDLKNPGIRDFSPMDYVEINGMVTVFNGGNQLNIHQIRQAPRESVDPSDYVAVSKYNIQAMQKQFLLLVDSVQNEYLQKLLNKFFHDQEFFEAFSKHSAAKTIHHSYLGGLLQHTLSVSALCDKISRHYGNYINRDLLISGALLHDIGKMKELSKLPLNEYTDDGQLLGHIMMGAQMIYDAASNIEGFPPKLRTELVHLILSHHGELDFGSPKKPALIEALVLSQVDNLDARVETMYEALNASPGQNPDGWVGFNKFLDTNIRKTSG